MDKEQDLIKDLIAGKEDAYKYIYDHHYQALCTYAYQYVKDICIAEMIVGDVIFSIWSKHDNLIITSSLRGYLMSAVRNTSINYLIREKKMEAIKSELQASMEKNTDVLTYLENTPLTKLIERELDLKIKDTLANMPDLTRRVFELSRFSDMKYHEIAETLDVSVDTVKYHMKVALSRLRNDLKDYINVLIPFLLILLKKDLF
ncbi:MAG: RNA polymerase sigma-70 factor [Prevotella sp.]|jgi:RNA polymerase sigma-70 factor (ECF subfamily)|uniref:RNA polymerase sigma-70 factor n=1 Tax=Dysgonomonas sp. TaxID=1891233 RepID=UPI00281AB7E7|nr:RNA polymerase sigma-70 factor [Dysgonomonas sp.]MDR1714577.1 RNA polymerase sigma-70 factor [Prevotella sp.]MDR2004254.1 RNA polymerase sigma-70 factor [Prevotella sp.]HMM03819.1 RNA polymerase sigma-70 factor [Dysgonomonas sp.]